ncbi:MAG: histidinol dehydrogenase, partial [Proteobacteria bacterium]|nr:histidinol dehydrogenase [Pseudomonadota bacterium]
MKPVSFAGVTQIKAPSRSAAFDNAAVSGLVSTILQEVRLKGDSAVRAYSQEFDQITLDEFEVKDADRMAAVAALDPQTRADTEFAIDNVKRFAQAQLATILPLDVELLPGVFMGHRVIPIEKVGCYVPGGRYPLLSAPIMTIVPAKVAKVDQVIACLPPNAHNAMIAGCHLAGADRIFRIGGAQAIAAMAYGTESVPAVHKIMGPGNAFVNEAKRQVFGPVGIDQLAGPSEIYTLADHSGDAEMLATDMLAQAEHDVKTRVGLITTDAVLAAAVLAEVERQLATLSTAHTAGPAWRDYGEIALCDSEDTIIAYSDHIAAEHLQVHTQDPHAFAQRLRNYGSLFIGPLASVVYSDKCSGTNHTLPTMAAGRYTGGLWVGSYVKIATHQWLTPQGVMAVAPP